MAARAEEVAGAAEETEKPLGRVYRPEALHPPLSETGGLMGSLDSAVPPGRRKNAQMLDSVHLRQALKSRPVAAQAIGDDPLRRLPHMAEQLTEEALGGVGIPAILQKDIEYLAVFVDGTPQVFPLAADPHKDLVQVPGPPWATLPTA